MKRKIKSSWHKPISKQLIVLVLSCSLILSLFMPVLAQGDSETDNVHTETTESEPEAETELPEPDPEAPDLPEQSEEEEAEPEEPVVPAEDEENGADGDDTTEDPGEEATKPEPDDQDITSPDTEPGETGGASDGEPAPEITEPDDKQDDDGSILDVLEFVYDPQPGSAEEIAALAENFDGDFEALPKWKDAINPDWLPVGWAQAQFEDEETGAFYWRLAPAIAPMAVPFSLPVTTFSELEAAVAAANNGDTIIIANGFLFENQIDISGKSITITYPDASTPVALEASNASKHFAIDTNASLTISGLKLDGCGIGGGVRNNGAFAMESGEICNVINENGAVENHGTFTMRGGKIHNNTCDLFGGGVYNNGHFYLLNGQISYNGATHGGGVYNQTGKTFSMSGGEINHNTATTYGGGVCNYGIYEMQGGKVASNQGIYGGGVYNQSYFSIVDAEISNNFAEQGGGIYNVRGGMLTLTSGDIAGNNASLHSGGVCNWSNSTFLMEGGKISTNTAPVCGGVRNNNSIFTMEDGEISGNNFTGVYNDSYSTFTLKNGAITGNTGGTSNAGGGVFNNATFVMEYGKISNNSAISGGGVCNQGFDATFTMQGGEISNNIAEDSGGGVFSSGSGAKFTMENGTVSGNSAIYKGGGFYNEDGSTLLIEDGTISNNTASEGGGIYNTKGAYNYSAYGIFTMTGGEIIDNTTSTNINGNGNGAGVSNRGIFVMEQGTISYNTTADGGGAGVFNGFSFTMNGGEISHNSGNVGGGVLQQNSYTSQDPDTGATFTMNGGEISHNTGNIGGGIMLSTSKSFTMHGGKIGSNSATFGGGGIYTDAIAQITVTGGQISSNTTSADGGGIYTRRLDKLIVSGDAVLTGNTASQAYLMTDEDDIALHNQQITTTVRPFSQGMIYAYNNFDINYTPPVVPVISHTVTFDPMGGIMTPGQETQLVNNGEKIVIPNAPEKEGHTFLGWYTHQTGGTQWNFITGTVTADITLYARWKANPVNHTVTFDPTGGAMPSAELTQSVPDGQKATIPTQPTKADHTFKGWYTEQTGGVKWNFGSDAVTGNMTLYAQWEADLVNHTVTFNPTGGAMPSAELTQSVPDGQKAAVPTQPTKADYTFQGWYTQSTGGTVWDFDTVITGDITLYAHWTPVVAEHTVTFNTNGGSPVPGNQTVPDGSLATKPDPSPTKEHFTFGGWYHGMTKWEFDAHTVDRDITLNAWWAPVTYTLTYDVNGGKANNSLPKESTHLYEAEVNVTHKKVERDGHTFLGWSTNPNADTAQYTGGDKLVILGDTTLYAVWSMDYYDLTYHANGGENPPEAETDLIYNEKVTLAERGDMTYEGHTFLGWSKNAEATTADYRPGNSFTIKEDTTLYAVWRNNAGYQITVEHYQYTEGDLENAVLVTADTQTHTLQYGDSFAAVPNSYEGYIYMANLSDAEIASVTANHTLKLYYMKSDGYQIIFEGIVDGRTSLEVLDRRDPAAMPMSWSDFLDVIQPKLYLDGKEITDSTITYTSNNYNAVNFRELTRGNPYTIAVTASWNNGTASGTGALLLDIVDTTPPVITVATNRVEFPINQGPDNMQYLLAVIQPLVSDNYDASVPFSAIFSDTTFESIDWSKRGEYGLYIEAKDSSNNIAQREAIIVAVVERSTAGPGDNSSGGSSGGGSNIRDDLDGKYIILDDDGVPLGFYTQDDNGNWIFIADEDTPLGTLPRTGTTANLAIAMLCMAVASAAAFFSKR